MLSVSKVYGRGINLVSVLLSQFPVDNNWIVLTSRGNELIYYMALFIVKSTGKVRSKLGEQIPGITRTIYGTAVNTVQGRLETHVQFIVLLSGLCN